ncbi:response regulator transcription factor [Paenibacillus soyae]|uniref:Response regulator transcription factor n=1 Tax=Paenibacillus soyae TaxID=2969249 RepID=A0A9X2MSY0_9BACL|nr:response regulator transcription factor [Paenibacillus soyae]MCR2805278.1 response regulator transcription factor [Paenibacillus soyae]
MREEQRLIERTGGMLCPLTKRIMVISPLPERVRGLLVQLTAECFDVFSLREFNKGMLSALTPELLVYDAMAIPLSSAGPVAGQTLHGGEELLRAAEQAGIPVLVLLDEGSYGERVSAMLPSAELLEWPAMPEEAMHRINRMLSERPAHSLFGYNEDIRMFKDIRVDLRKMKVEKSGVRVDLTKTEYDLLLFFLNSDGSVLTREALLDNVWGMHFYGGSNVVDVHIKSLRKKLKDSAVSPKYIVTVRGAGYRLADEQLH